MYSIDTFKREYPSMEIYIPTEECGGGGGSGGAGGVGGEGEGMQGLVKDINRGFSIILKVPLWFN